MTAQRQERNGSRPGIAFICFCLAAVGFGVPTGLLVVVHAATTERVVANRYTGLAIEGFDPVAYFVDAQPKVGFVTFEASQAGVVWRFRNEGNRASFLAHPDIYGPQFGGYDPVDMARGITVAGNPRFWLISDQRLYLFSRENARDAFAADPAPVLKEARQRWPEIEENLAR
jgi:hypothetical protein